MQKVRDLIHNWNSKTAMPKTAKELTVKLSARDYARLCALTEIYPGCAREQILGDLASAALDEVEEAFPYIKGSRVVAEDEFGEPVYEDIGLTPRFEELTHKYYRELEAEG